MNLSPPGLTPRSRRRRHAKRLLASYRRRHIGFSKPGAMIPLLAIAGYLLVTRRGIGESLWPAFAAQLCCYAAAFTLSAFGPSYAIHCAFRRLVLTLFPAFTLLLFARGSSASRVIHTGRPPSVVSPNPEGISSRRSIADRPPSAGEPPGNRRRRRRKDRSPRSRSGCGAPFAAPGRSRVLRARRGRRPARGQGPPARGAESVLRCRRRRIPARAAAPEEDGNARGPSRRAGTRPVESSARCCAAAPRSVQSRTRRRPVRGCRVGRRRRRRGRRPQPRADPAGPSAGRGEAEEDERKEGKVEPGVGSEEETLTDAGGKNRCRYESPLVSAGDRRAGGGSYDGGRERPPPFPAEAVCRCIAGRAPAWGELFGGQEAVPDPPQQ